MNVKAKLLYVTISSLLCILLTMNDLEFQSKSENVAFSDFLMNGEGWIIFV